MQICANQREGWQLLLVAAREKPYNSTQCWVLSLLLLEWQHPHTGSTIMKMKLQYMAFCTFLFNSGHSHVFTIIRLHKMWKSKFRVQSAAFRQIPFDVSKPPTLWVLKFFQLWNEDQICLPLNTGIPYNFIKHSELPSCFEFYSVLFFNMNSTPYDVLW